MSLLRHQASRRVPGWRGWDLGLTLVALGAACLACNTTLAKAAYHRGATATTLLLVRYLVSTAVLLTSLRLRGLTLLLPRRLLLGCLACGALMVLTSLAYLGAVQLIPLSLAVLLIYTQPAWTAILSRLLGVERLTAAKVGAVALAMAGVGTMVGVDFSRFTPAGLALGLLAGLAYGLVATVGRQVSLGADTLQVNAWTALIGIPASLATGLLLGNLRAPPDLPSLAAMVGSAVFYIAGFILIFAGLQRTLPVRAGVATTLEPVLTVVLSVLFLGEPLTPGLGLGGAMVVAAVLLVAAAGRL